jgi:phthalate 4,5-dioxygenase
MGGQHAMQANENELLTRVGPGTPMGELMRRYWIPALLSSEVTPNGDPVRVRLLGENYVCWRDASGQLGFFDEGCMHRGASLALARAQGDRLQCLYHGWQYATDGTILETPNCLGTRFKERLRAPVHPVREAGEIIWTYLGPEEKEPPFPHYRFMDVPDENRGMFRVTIDCSYLQVLEGQIDPSHAPILHQDYVTSNFSPGTKAAAEGLTRGHEESKLPSFTVQNQAVKLILDDTDFGCQGAAVFDALDEAGRDAKFIRVYGFVTPFLCLPPPSYSNFCVPIDDEHTSHIQLLYDAGRPFDREAYLKRHSVPSDAYENGHYRHGEAERWGQDRSRMNDYFAGIPGVTSADWMVMSSMGPIVDRTKETLTPADRLITRVRRVLLRTVRNLEDGIEPTMLTPNETISVQSGHGLVDDEAEWRSIVPANERFRHPMPSEAM